MPIRKIAGQGSGTIAIRLQPMLRCKKRRRLRSMRPALLTSLRANGSRERAPDDRLREAIHSAACGEMDCFVASLLAMTYGYSRGNRNEYSKNFASARGPARGWSCRRVLHELEDAGAASDGEGLRGG